MRITKATARKVLEVVDAGLVKGLGVPTPGRMCVEAAVCYALGLEHSDEPTCVSPALRALKIALNDADWSSRAARTAGLRKLSILQLGTNEGFNEQEFARRVVLLVTNTTVADTFANLSKLYADFGWGKPHVAPLSAAASVFRAAKTLDLVCSAAYSAAASAAYSAARSADAAAASAACSADAAAASADAAARSAAYSAAASADAARSAYSAAAYSVRSAVRSAAYSARSTASTASAASAARSAARSTASAASADKVLSTFAEGVAAILVDMNVLGVKWLDLL